MTEVDTKKAAKEAAAAKAKEAAAAKAKEAAAAKAKAKAVKEAEAVAKAEAKAKAKAEREAAKANKPPRELRPVQNGIRLPKPETICGRVWALMDSMRKAANGNAPSLGEVLRESAKTADFVPGNVTSEYASWRKFNGIIGRIADPEKSAKREAADKAKAEQKAKAKAEKEASAKAKAAEKKAADATKAKEAAKAAAKAKAKAKG